MLHDLHTHTRFSPDSQADMAAMCQQAVQAGLAEIGFTEHYDLHPLETTPAYLRPEPWLAELEHCRARFAGTLTVRAGVELGEPHLFPAEVHALLAAHPFDYALGSLHWVGQHSVFDTRWYAATPPDEAWGAYFTELLTLARTGEMDVLSHFDVPVRVAHSVYGSYEPTRYEHLIRPVLAACVARGLALDVNTAALRRPANRLTPDVTVLRWFVELGGSRVTLGSDAHRPEHVAAGLPQALQAVRAAGLTHLTTFHRRTPHSVPLPA